MSAIVLRAAGGRVSLRLHRRPFLVGAALALLTFATVVLALTTGDFPLSVGQVLAVLVGRGDPGDAFIVETLRLPRVLTAVLVGAAFGVAGAIFQSITRNPLGSPDVIGFTAGSASGALLVILTTSGGAVAIALGSVAGGVVTAAVVYLLAFRGGVQGYRLVLVGIGIGYALYSLNDYLITRATREDALEASHWLVGSLNGRGWEHVWPVAAALAVLLPLALLLSRSMQLLELGDDAASALGVGVQRARLALAALAVALTAVGTASTGPVLFVALASPQIARRLTRAAVPGLGTSALTGATLMAAGDFAAQRLLDQDLPVGVVTGLVGGVFLAWLLTQEWRTR
ncbi:iron chelate uptake ABC transporter family permease subunit [Conexibacter sp. W3-3-2]|uniref:FecCD family ABC transporter permease n=1 Tax=Conexibacter sp. W3-3-2 TaxID=2675227 RepID=UPI0013252FFF|nr:iron chelate uptake ABC transporter family permease subunit [Conexibacter sp. W3-3-2]MTD46033.1 iron chelate uptake ABC transporter family permease subunit [Conexibacter sp. W3-3-2]